MNDSYSHDLPLSTFSKAFGDVLPALNACGIDSLSEFLGALGGLRRLEERPPLAMQLEGALGLLDDKPPFDSSEEWESYKAFYLEPETSFEPIASTSDFTPRDPSKIAQFPSSTPLRRDFKLNFSPFPIRNQRDANSCVAHAVASAIEYCLGKEIDEETTRKLFEACRSIDGIGGNGTILSAALTIARESELLRSARVLAPGAISLWKETLVGVKGAKKSPIIAAFATYRSWLYSKSARLSGKWTLPLPEEPCAGLHAALVVGYEDDPAYPGGGFFLVRNSWGEEYARDSKTPGYARVPYGYVQRCCVEAYAARDEKTDDFESKFVRVLEAEARDLYGRLCDIGTKVVAHRDEPGRFLADSSNARSEFVKQGYAWTPERRVLNYFPAVDFETKNQVEARLKASQGFAKGVGANLNALIGTESPFSPRGVFSGVKRFRAVEEIADLSESVRTELARRNGLHEEIDLTKDAPREWRSAIEASALVKVWRVDDGKKAFAVVGTWLAPLRFSPLESPKFETPTAEALDIAFKVVDEWKRGSSERFESIGESVGLFDFSWRGLEGVARRGDFCVLSTFDPKDRGGRWRSTPCETFGDERTRGLVSALFPTTLEDMIAYVQSVVERESLVFFGDFTVDYVATKSGASKKEVETALDELVKNGKYEIYQTARREKAYRKK